jgi:uncharacterized protein (DUF2062 family)
MEEELREAISIVKDINQRIQKLEEPNYMPVIVISILLSILFVFIIIFYDREVYHRSKEMKHE